MSGRLANPPLRCRWYVVSSSSILATASCRAFRRSGAMPSAPTCAVLPSALYQSLTRQPQGIFCLGGDVVGMGQRMDLCGVAAAGGVGRLLCCAAGACAAYCCAAAAGGAFARRGAAGGCRVGGPLCTRYEARLDDLQAENFTLCIKQLARAADRPGRERCPAAAGQACARRGVPAWPRRGS